MVTILDQYVLANIVSFLDLNAIYAVRRVSRIWREASESPIVREQIILQLNQIGLTGRDYDEIQCYFMMQMRWTKLSFSSNKVFLCAAYFTPPDSRDWLREINSLNYVNYSGSHLSNLLLWKFGPDAFHRAEQYFRENKFTYRMFHETSASPYELLSAYHQLTDPTIVRHPRIDAINLPIYNTALHSFEILGYYIDEKIAMRRFCDAALMSIVHHPRKSEDRFSRESVRSYYDALYRLFAKYRPQFWAQNCDYITRCYIFAMRGKANFRL